MSSTILSDQKSKRLFSTESYLRSTIQNLICAKPEIHGTTLITYIVPGKMDL
jgi:hypothetical protein